MWHVSHTTILVSKKHIALKPKQPTYYSLIAKRNIMRYKKYRLHILTEQKKLKRAGLLKGRVTPDSLLRAIAIQNSQRTENTDLVEEDLLEISFLKNNRPAIFPESTELIDAIIKSSFSAVDETAFPYGYGLIYMPRSHRLPSFMYSIINSGYMNELYSPYYDIKYQQLGFSKGKVEELKKQLFNAYSFDHKILRISYYTKDNKLRIRTSPLEEMLPILATDPNILNISFKESDTPHR